MTDSEREPGSKAAWTAAAVLLVASLTGAFVLAEWPLWGVGGGPAEPQLVEPAENGSELWPYTARGTRYGERTLAINVVVVGDTDLTHRAMVERSELEWRDPDAAGPDEGGDARNRTNPDRERLGEGISWGRARGAVRYTHVRVDGQKRWVDESYQLHSGDYLGQRLHVRAYEDPKGEWTAMQAHSEHWDWFRLRHTVTGVSGAQRQVESDFMGTPFVDGVTRQPYERAGSDSRRWVTEVRLWAFVLAGFGLALSGRTERAYRTAERFVHRHHREVSMGVALFSLYLGIRVAGIALETALPAVNPKYIAAPLYLLLVLGLPGIAYRFGRGTNRVWAFAHAVGALGTAFVVDLALMGVSDVPLPFVLHRLAVLSAIGLIATGVTFRLEDGNRAPLAIGVAGWIAVIVLPALGYL